ncbi:putative glyoxalase superfamily protein PhnB [Rhodoligotrophos appendicifer]|uniref:VOC family protein n=1 Tax=Rhodoligotrophos appendicifer TaxID=987056 RepID=UPI0011801EAB|nr:VOC family protein [Rhodoligotrophos appendicifer]
MTEPANPSAPEVLGGVIAYLNVDGAVKAAEFYQRAFGAKEVFRHDVDDKGRTMHIHLHINGSSVMLSDFYPEHGFGKVPSSGFSLLIPVTDIDAWFKRAVDAGAEVVMPPEIMFWGDKYGQVKDPFGVAWAFNQSMCGSS